MRKYTREQISKMRYDCWNHEFENLSMQNFNDILIDGHVGWQNVDPSVVIEYWEENIGPEEEEVVEKTVNERIREQIQKIIEEVLDETEKE